MKRAYKRNSYSFDWKIWKSGSWWVEVEADEPKSWNLTKMKQTVISVNGKNIYCSSQNSTPANPLSLSLCPSFYHPTYAVYEASSVLVYGDARSCPPTRIYIYETLWSKTEKITEKKPLNHSLSQERWSEQSEQTSKQVSVKEASRAEPANKWCERTSKRMSKWPSTFVRVFGWSGPQCPHSNMV